MSRPFHPLSNLFWLSCICCLISMEIIANHKMGPQELVFVILSQTSKYHEQKALLLKDNLLNQTNLLTGIQKRSKISSNSRTAPLIYISQIDFKHKGDWTIFPLIPKLNTLLKNNNNYTAIFFLQDSTHVNLAKLLRVLSKYKDKEAFIGYPLEDQEPTIIHHFALNLNDEAHFKYPNFASGFAITRKLLQSLASRIAAENVKSNFNIDASYELALFIWNNGTGLPLSSETSFCPTNVGEDCATYAEPFVICGPPVDKHSILFAVKTFSDFHSTRVDVVKNTWAQYAPNVLYFSNVEDPSIPTINLGIENVERGHCAKTFAILKYLHKEIFHKTHYKWIALVDDDTILSPTNLAKYLSCFDPNENVILGERYGFGADLELGYNYISGGGGTVLSRRLLELLVHSGCDCPSPDSPDDMYLGFCLNFLEIDLIHSPFFHQARPIDYALDYLKSHQSNIISFHKHWMIDPVEVFEEWFGKWMRVEEQYDKREDL